MVVEQFCICQGRFRYTTNNNIISIYVIWDPVLFSEFQSNIMLKHCQVLILFFYEIRVYLVTCFFFKLCVNDKW